MSLQIDGLHHHYGAGRGRTGPEVLRGVNLDLAPGITGLLGGNGAGKSTLIRILATLLRPSKGTVKWQGQDVLTRPKRLRQVLGYLPQDFAVYPQFTALEFLQYVGSLKELNAADVRRQGLALLEQLQLEPGRLLSTCSGGMRQRVGIAQALLGRPELLVLDEPTVGLDLEQRLNFKRMLGALASSSVILLSTHIVTDLEDTVDQVALLAAGQVAFHGAPEQLFDEMQGQLWTWTQPADGPPCAVEGPHITVQRGQQLEVRCLQAAQPHPHARLTRPTLEDAYRLYAQLSSPQLSSPQTCVPQINRSRLVVSSGRASDDDARGAHA